MKKIYMLALALMVLFSMTLSAEALTQKTVYRQDGMAAYTEWIETTPEGLTTDTYLSVIQSDVGTDVYLSICTYDMAGGSCKYGYELAQNNVISIDKKLQSASLIDTTINLYQWSCDEIGCWETPAGQATIGATWAGTGDLLKGSYKWTSKYGDHMEKGSDSSISRTATAQGSINGNDLGTSDFAGLAIFKSVYMYMLK